MGAEQSGREETRQHRPGRSLSRPPLSGSGEVSWAACAVSGSRNLAALKFPFMGGILFGLRLFCLLK